MKNREQRALWQEKSYKFPKVLETYKTHKISLQVGRGETLLPVNFP